MKEIAKFSSQLEAQMAAEYLSTQGIEPEVRGAKDYISHYMGADKGAFKIFVQENQATQAQNLLKDVEDRAEPADLDHSASTYYRRAIISAAIAMTFFPVIFHVTALWNLKLFWQTEQSSQKRMSGTLVVTFLLLTSLWIWYYLATRIFKLF